MKKRILVASLLALVISAADAQKLSKDDSKRIKDELKNYMKHPEEYKSKMDRAQEDRDSSEAQLSRLRLDLKASQATEADLQAKLASDDEQTKILQEENDKLREKATEAAATPEGKASEMKAGSSKGTVFKIQLGMYKGLNVNRSFDQPRYLGYEEVNGMNRYVIGSFPDQEAALKFVADIRKLGIHDAFVAKYIDGTRVYEWSENPKYKGKKVPDSLEDALEKDSKKKVKHAKSE